MRNFVSDSTAFAASAARPHPLRVALAPGCAALLLAAVGLVFWYQDGRYSLPTPRPPAQVSVGVSGLVALPANAASAR